MSEYLIKGTKGNILIVDVNNDGLFQSDVDKLTIPADEIGMSTGLGERLKAIGLDASKINNAKLKPLAEYANILTRFAEAFNRENCSDTYVPDIDIFYSIARTSALEAGILFNGKTIMNPKAEKCYREIAKKKREMAAKDRANDAAFDRFAGDRNEKLARLYDEVVGSVLDDLFREMPVAGRMFYGFLFYGALNEGVDKARIGSQNISVYAELLQIYAERAGIEFGEDTRKRLYKISCGYYLAEARHESAKREKGMSLEIAKSLAEEGEIKLRDCSKDAKD